MNIMNKLVSCDLFELNCLICINFNEKFLCDSFVAFHES